MSETLNDVFIDLSSPSDRLFIFFTGKNVADVKRSFNFMGVSQRLPVKKIFVRDVQNKWYHGCFKGVGDGPDELVNYLKSVIDSCKPQRVVTCGASMGGYAAILFGCLLKANMVIAFGPQTFIDWQNRLKYLDGRSFREKNRLYRLASAKREYFVLRPLVERVGRDTEVIIHVGQHRLDNRHAEQLADLPNVRLVKHDYKRHEISRALKSRGLLIPILLEALELKASPMEGLISA